MAIRPTMAAPRPFLIRTRNRGPSSALITGRLIGQHHRRRQQHDGRSRIPHGDRLQRHAGLHQHQSGRLPVLVRDPHPQLPCPGQLVELVPIFLSDRQPSQPPSDNLPCTPGSTDVNYASPRSHHPGGVNVLFCDGSLHFIPNAINLAPGRAWAGLPTGKRPLPISEQSPTKMSEGPV